MFKPIVLLFWFILYCFLATVLTMDNILQRFHQSDYKVAFQRAEVTYFNKEYVKYFTMTTFKYNRTQAVVNATAEFAKDFGNNLMFIHQTYKLSGNEYRTFPIRFQLSVCSCIEYNLIGFGATFLSENSDCPLKKNVVYRITNYYPDETQFPPLVPNGHFKLHFDFLFTDKIVITSNMYIEIYRPIVPYQ